MKQYFREVMASIRRNRWQSCIVIASLLMGAVVGYFLGEWLTWEVLKIQSDLLGLAVWTAIEFLCMGVPGYVAGEVTDQLMGWD